MSVKMVTNNKKKKTRNEKSVEDKKGLFSDSSELLMKSNFLMPFLHICLVIVLACICGFAHRQHVRNLFENQTHFSHLSTLERELSFRTEMGLYYSYFKVIIEAPTFMQGINAIMHDNRTEYPSMINTLKRFNLYPEVAISGAYRIFMSICEYYNIRTMDCWSIDRGEKMPPIQSCEGLGEPAYFYSEVVFCLHGLLMSVYFLFGTYLSESIFGGALTVACIFFNHGECTRVMWTPPLRESFAFPVFALQMLLVTHLIKKERTSVLTCIGIVVTSIGFMLPWQFSQFALLTQVMGVFGTYVLKYIDSRKTRAYTLCQAVSLIVCYLCMFGNEMLLTGFYMSAILSVIIVLCLESLIKKLKFTIIIMAVQLLLVLLGTILLKVFVSKLFLVSDDAHIADILRSKFTDFKTFDTMLYTCAKEFGFMEREYINKITSTLLTPSAAVIVFLILIMILKQLYRNICCGHGTKKKPNNENFGSRHNAELVYTVFQLSAFTIMAVLIMRLKLFLTPYLCVVMSLVASRQVFGWIKRKDVHLSLVALLIAGMSVTGYQNLQSQWKISGEYSNYPMEELVEWINKHATKGNVFAGAMPTMATVKLCTNKSIVNHPHFEDSALRERTKRVYTLFSRKPVEEVYRTFTDMKVDYALIDKAWCMWMRGSGCSITEIWDLEDEENRNNPVACEYVMKNPNPFFKPVFKNKDFVITQVLKS